MCNMTTVEDKLAVLWVKAHAAAYAPLSFNITREVCHYLPKWCPLPLVCISPSSLRFFDFHTLTLGPDISFEGRISVGNYTWVTVSSTRVFVCGGGYFGPTRVPTAVKTALCIYQSGRFERLPDLLFAHSDCGVIWWNGAINVFGSYIGPDQTKSECLRNENWERLPDMHRRRSLFTPVVWRAVVYLCGGYANETVESFDGETMRLLDISLPEGNAALACVDKDSLIVIITPECKTVISGGRNSDVLSVSCTSRVKSFEMIRSNPVLWNGIIYIAEPGGVKKLSAIDGNRLR